MVGRHEGCRMLRARQLRHGLNQPAPFKTALLALLLHLRSPLSAGHSPLLAV